MSAGVSVQHQTAFPPPPPPPPPPSRHTDRVLSGQRAVHAMPHSVPQYAWPIHDPNSHPTRGHNRPATDGGALAGPSSENTLRRKTPNGTISAGYDPSPDASDPPHKHQLRNGKQPCVQQEQFRNPNNHAWSPGSQAWQSGNALMQPQIPFTAIDSMIYQATGNHLTPQQYYGSTIPSVIQPSFQYIGPTALGQQGSGPYGPYWHDGTFVPYRAAATRDPRFYHHGPGTPFTGSSPAGQMPYQATLWQRPAAPPVQAWNSAQALSPIPSPGLAFSDAQYGMGSGHMIQRRDLPLNHTSRLTQSTTLDGQLTPWGIDAEFGPSSPNGRQRDQVFTWALQQYRNLLIFIHQTRQRQQHTRALHGQPQTPQRPSFYPKPPRPVPMGSSAEHFHRKTGSDPVQRYDEDGKSQPGASNSDILTPIDPDSATPEARTLTVWSPYGLHLHDNEYARRASHDQYQSATHRAPPSMAVSLREPQTVRRSSGSNVSAILPLVPHDDSPPARAAAALAYMTDSCAETDWTWTDGMHLAGGLAYGLEQYSKALRWFTAVLDRDPKHLEAMSNLAATMLALGRRQEAEQYWTKVVQAAPNHFEAVEHLVGLLCNDHRSRDAIKVIEDVEQALRRPKAIDSLKTADRQSECSASTASCSPCTSESTDKISYDFEPDSDALGMGWKDSSEGPEPGFGSSGFAIPGCDNGRILALIHAKGNMLYGLGDNAGAARAFEDAVLIAAGRRFRGVPGLVQHILTQIVNTVQSRQPNQRLAHATSTEPILLTPHDALQTAKWCFPYMGELPGLFFIPGGPQSLARRAVVSTTSNALLSLAKIFQDGMSNANRSVGVTPLAHGVRDILALYYLSLSLQPSPSTANNVGILLASVQQATPIPVPHQRQDIPGVVPGSGIALALQYYNYGLQLDQHHAHLYTNLGSLLKDIGQLDAAINMYERAVKCDGRFDIALANLANAVKDKGRINDAIAYYRRAVDVNPDFAEAICGLANALNSVCGWPGRGGISDDGGKRDRWHVDANGMLFDARVPGTTRSGWIKRVVEIVDKQLTEGENWGVGTLSPATVDDLVRQFTVCDEANADTELRRNDLRNAMIAWSGQGWEGARVTRLVERATKRIGWQWYRDLYVDRKERSSNAYKRPQLPGTLAVPTAPTVLPFHTFTCPMSAEQIRLISQRNGLRISVSTLRAPWIPAQVYRPPQPPAPYLRVGYVSSDFNNHPLAHLMQSVFGLHDRRRVKAYCYATTASDNSVHRQQIRTEAPVFHDASAWSAERLTKQIVKDGIHILVNLNGYTRGARNEVFAARPAPIQMSFMGFAGTLGAEWCDYLLADEIAVPPDTLRPYRRNVDLPDQLADDNSGGAQDEWVYGENIIYCRDTFFCCDHKQSAPDTAGAVGSSSSSRSRDAPERALSWADEQRRRWRMRRELFPDLPDDAIILGNFNQLYKIDPTTFRTWLRILSRVPRAVLWLLRFPDLGEAHLLATARLWAGAGVAARIRFTDVAPKHLHIARARACDLVVDTAECNAHTTAADVLWSGTPLLTLPRYPYKMCSRMAASILRGALPRSPAGDAAAADLIAVSEDDYEEKAVALAQSLVYPPGCAGVLPVDPVSGEGAGRLMELRQLLFHARWSSALFDTRRWVRDLEDAYDEAWRRWVDGRGGDIWLDRVPRGGSAASA